MTAGDPMLTALGRQLPPVGSAAMILAQGPSWPARNQQPHPSTAINERIKLVRSNISPGGDAVTRTGLIPFSSSAAAASPLPPGYRTMPGACTAARFAPAGGKNQAATLAVTEVVR